MATLLIHAYQDSWINEDAKDANYGDGVYLYVQSRDVNRDRRGYIRFKLTGPNSWEQLPAWAVPTSVKLYYYVDLHFAGTGGLKINAYRVTTTWAEGTITWNVVPSNSDVLYGQANHAVAQGWVSMSLDLTEFELMRALPRGVLLKYNTEGQAQTYNTLISTENEEAATKQAYLEVTYTGGVASQVVWMMCKIQDFFKELKLGRIPSNKLLEQYGDLLAI